MMSEYIFQQKLIKTCQMKNVTKLDSSLVEFLVFRISTFLHEHTAIDCLAAKDPFLAGNFSKQLKQLREHRWYKQKV